MLRAKLDPRTELFFCQAVVKVDEAIQDVSASTIATSQSKNPAGPLPEFVRPHSFRAYGAPSGDVRASFDVSPENKSDNCFSLLDKKDYAHSDDGDQWLYDDGAPKHFTTDMAFAASLARPSSGPLQFDISCAAISDVVDSVQDERTKAAGTRSCEAPRRPREARGPVLLFYN